jgi:hypothetical protein
LKEHKKLFHLGEMMYALLVKEVKLSLEHLQQPVEDVGAKGSKQSDKDLL